MNNLNVSPGATSSNSPSRSWVFTVNNYTPEAIEALVELGNDASVVTYVVAGREVGESGTPHLQGCITFTKPHRRSGVAKMIPNAWLEPAKRLFHAREYCKKQDPEPVEIDNRKQGQRTDLEMVVATLQTGGMKAVVDEHPCMFVKFHGGLERLEVRLQSPRDPGRPPQVWWIYGPTGSGKSRFVHETEPDLWVALGGHKWWEGYTQQAAILIDDMRCNYAPFNELLKIIDRYPYTAERKGGSVQVNSPRIYITSQFPPHKVYNRENRNDEDIRQLYRRLGAVYEAHRTYTSFEGSSFLRHGVKFQAKNVEELLALDQESGNLSPGFVNPWP